MKSDYDVLTGAIELVEGDGAWCQGAFCRSADGKPLVNGRDSSGIIWREDITKASGQYTSDGYLIMEKEVGDELLVPASFCLEGALRMAGGLFDPLIGEKTARIVQFHRLQHLIESQVHEVVVSFNDAASTTREDAILALKVVREQLPPIGVTP